MQKFVFCLLSSLLEKLGKVNFQGIHWAIVGGESGAKARPMKKAMGIEYIRAVQQSKNIFLL